MGPHRIKGKLACDTNTDCVEFEIKIYENLSMSVRAGAFNDNAHMGRIIQG